MKDSRNARFSWKWWQLLESIGMITVCGLRKFCDHVVLYLAEVCCWVLWSWVGLLMMMVWLMTWRMPWNTGITAMLLLLLSWTQESLSYSVCCCCSSPTAAGSSGSSKCHHAITTFQFSLWCSWKETGCACKSAVTSQFPDVQHVCTQKTPSSSTKNLKHKELPRPTDAMCYEEAVWELSGGSSRIEQGCWCTQESCVLEEICGHRDG